MVNGVLDLKVSSVIACRFLWITVALNPDLMFDGVID